jgi:hypothetical protein
LNGAGWEVVKKGSAATDGQKEASLKLTPTEKLPSHQSQQFSQDGELKELVQK